MPVNRIVTVSKMNEIVVIGKMKIKISRTINSPTSNDIIAEDGR